MTAAAAAEVANIHAATEESEPAAGILDGFGRIMNNFGMKWKENMSSFDKRAPVYKSQRWIDGRIEKVRSCLCPETWAVHG